MGKEKICFVISPIGEPESDIRKRSDQVFNHVISPAVEPLGYKPIRADHISEPGIITTQVIQHVVDSPLVVADLTGRNPNVFYELAIRHGIRKPLIQMIRRGEQIPFDVAGTRTIHVDIHDLDSVEEAKQELVNQVKSIEQGVTEIDSPISVAIDLRILRESEDPKERSLADVVEAISEVRSGILSLESRLTSPQSLLPPDYVHQVISEASRRWLPDGASIPELRDVIGYLDSISEDTLLDYRDVQMLSERLRRAMGRPPRHLY